MKDDVYILYIFRIYKKIFIFILFPHLLNKSCTPVVYPPHQSHTCTLVTIIMYSREHEFVYPPSESAVEVWVSDGPDEHTLTCFLFLNMLVTVRLHTSKYTSVSLHTYALTSTPTHANTHTYQYPHQHTYKPTPNHTSFMSL